jgi:hypothetical protein
VGVVLNATIGSAIGEIFFVFAVPIVTPIATSQAIRKAGFSPWWNAVPISVSVLYYALLLDLIAGSRVFSFSLAYLRTAFDLWALLVVDLFINWVLFLIFCLASWPSLSPPSHRFAGVGPNLSAPYGGAGTPRSYDPSPPPPSRAQPPGWYQVGRTNNDQAYWNGETWTARRRWEGAGWNESPIVPDPTT